MNDEEQTESAARLAELRQQARELGFGQREDDTGVGLEPVDDFIARMRARDGVPSTSPMRPRRRRRWMVTSAIAVAAATVAVAVVLRPSGAPVMADTPPVLDFEYSSAVRIAYAPGEPATATFDLLTGAADDAPASTGEGPVQHHVSDNWFSDQDDSGNSVVTPRITESWLRPDGSLVTRDSVGEQLTPDGRGVPTERPGYSKDPVTSVLPAGTVDATFPEGLSTDPVTLRAQLLEHAGCASQTRPSSERSFCLLEEVRALFSTYVVEPRLAAAVWQALRGEEGFTSLGSVEDRAGRNGVGISLVPEQRPQYRSILIASTETGQLLGTEVVLIRADPNLSVEPPAVIEFTAITSADRTGSSPGAR